MAKDIIIKIPNSFTQDQIDFIKNSAMNQISAELRKDLKIPQAAIDAVDAEVETLKVAMEIAEELGVASAEVAL